MSREPGGASIERVDWWVQVPFFLALTFVPWSRSLTTVAWGALTLAFLWRLARREIHLPRAVWIGFLAFLSTWGASCLGSLNLRATAADWVGWVGMCAPMLGVLARRDRGPMPPALHATWLVSSLGLGVWLMGEMLTGRHLLLGHYPALSYPTMVNPNTAYQYSLLLFGWSFAWALTRPPGSAIRWLWTVAWIIALMLVSASGSRASWIAFTAMTAFLSWRTRRPIMGVAAMAAFVSCNAIFPHMMLDRARMLADFRSEAILGRAQGWLAALRMIAERPFTGEGLGAWRAAYALVRSPDFPPVWPHAHNIYLNTLAESGFLGLSGLILLLWGFHAVWRAGIRGRDPVPEELGISSALIGFALVGCVDLTWLGEPGFAFFALACFTLGRHCRRASLTPVEAH